MSVQNRHENPVQAYIDQTFAPEDELMQRIRAKGEELRAGMQISASEGQLLTVLAKMIGAKRILEVGCFMGYSAISLARALPEGGELITLEYSSDYAAIAREHFVASGLPITLIEGAGLDSIAELNGQFDLIFIDADKANYLNYLHATLPLLRKGGLMIGDNTLLFGAMIGEQHIKVSDNAIDAMRKFNETIADRSLFDGVMIPTDEGLSVGIKR